MGLPDFVHDLGTGIYAIDTAFQREHFDAAYLLVEQGRAAFIDTGTNHSVPRLLAALDAVGLGHEAVDFVIPTHVHLDHAGGVGLLMQALPRAQLIVHPRGLRHMLDPSALWAGALAVYGEAEMQRSYGELQPVAAERASASSDGQIIELAGRPLLLLDTPGHARHHHCIWDKQSRCVFTGDTFGLSYREFDNAAGQPWMLPTSTPVQFEPEALRQSIERLLALQPEGLCLTHFARVGHSVAEVRMLAAQLLQQVDQMVSAALALRDSTDRHEALKRALQTQYLRSAGEHGSVLTEAEMAALMAMDVELNAQGLGIWMDKLAPPAG
ncbi:MBL fold metallo-hydrolase [Paucibacter sp. APW11]|uniref:MBL fold metallo-hydrolase n=1 Tax=Roseateles aquae TaxID=3077235 RepID=A0ABU3PG17_9BURK|nr:MBL fold metallo-hydrolase [Paucibacter sp. APW11]MDT9001521.1 MBL fold metallo-hydrolase [Paucibacter sp. APW11]